MMMANPDVGYSKIPLLEDRRIFQNLLACMVATGKSLLVTFKSTQSTQLIRIPSLKLTAKAPEIESWTTIVPFGIANSQGLGFCCLTSRK